MKFHKGEGWEIKLILLCCSWYSLAHFLMRSAYCYISEKLRKDQLQERKMKRKYLNEWILFLIPSCRNILLNGMESVDCRAEKNKLTRKYKIWSSFSKLIILEERLNEDDCFQTS